MHYFSGLLTALVLTCSVGCTHAAPPPSAPPRLPPVLCGEFPTERQDVVSCRYASQAQVNEVWARSAQLAATSAISFGATHIQWLSVETSVETVRENSPVECRPTWGAFSCNGGAYDMPIGFVAVTRFAILSAPEAAARLNDPLVPAERRPLDARRIAAATPR